jgi:RNA polymerase sigma-70 factor (subfamily 1)
MAVSEKELLAKATEHDPEAVGALLERYGPQVREGISIARKWRSVLSVDDVMQVTYLEAFLRIGSFVPSDDGSFLAWLRRIAANNLRDAVKELGRAKRPPPERRIRARTGEDSFDALIVCVGGTTTTPSRGAARHEAQRLLEKAIGGLPKDYQQVVREHDLAGRSAVEVASSMERSKGAIYMLRARAHDELREALGSPSRFFSHGA